MIFQKTRKFLAFFSLLSLIFITFSCGQSKEEENKDENIPNEEESAEIKAEIDEIITEVPKPSEIPYIIQGTGANYNPGIANDVSKADQYKTTDNKAALNLGVYATDLGYICVYKKVNDALKYINAAKSLTDKLGISNAFEPQVIEKFENNLDNIDTLTAIVDNSLASSDKYLKDGKRHKIAALIFAGSFVEGLYVSINIITEYNEDLPADIKDEVLLEITREVLSREKGVSDLHDALAQLEADDDVSQLMTHLDELKKLYKAQNIEEKIQNNQGDYILTADENLINIAKKVKEIREVIINQ